MNESGGMWSERGGHNGNGMGKWGGKRRRQLGILSRREKENTKRKNKCEVRGASMKPRSSSWVRSDANERTTAGNWRDGKSGP